MNEQTSAAVAMDVNQHSLGDFWFDKISANTLLWQLIVIFIFLYFRKEIKQLLTAIIAKIPDIRTIGNCAFSKETTEALKENKGKMKEEILSYTEVVKQDPAIVFLTHFIDFERTLRILYSLDHSDDQKRVSLLQMLEQLAKEGTVEKRSVSIYRDIYGIRNKLVHGDCVFSGPEEANQYLEAILLLKDSIGCKKRLHNWESCAS